jgi:hypothetical protein
MKKTQVVDALEDAGENVNNESDVWFDKKRERLTSESVLPVMTTQASGEAAAAAAASEFPTINQATLFSSTTLALLYRSSLRACWSSSI